jgi:uncharacterized membrane protein
MGLTLRTALAISSGSAFLYLLQPIVTLFIVSAVFLGSVVASRPLVARMAHDFCPLTAEIAERWRIRRHFRNLTLLWAGLCFTNAGIALSLLLSMRVGTYLAVKPITTGAVTWTGVAVTVVWSVRVAQLEGIVGRRGRALQPA